MSFSDLLKTLLEDWVRYRWKDTVALTLIAFGFTVLLHTANAAACDSAKGVIGAGLIILDPRGMLPGTSGRGTGNGNGASDGHPSDVATSANPGAPPQTSAKTP
jgi:hypothetical protein